MISSKIFRVYLFFFVITALVPMLISNFITYKILANSIMDQIHEKESQALKQYQNAADQTLFNIPNIAVQLSSNFSDYFSSNEDFISLSYIDLKRMFNFNNSILTYNEYIESIYFYSDKINRFVVNDYFSEWSSFHDKKWLDEYLAATAKNGIKVPYWFYNRAIPNLTNSTYAGMTYVQPFSVLNSNRSGYIVININTEKFFKKIFSSDSSMYLVIDDNNQKIFGASSAFDTQIEAMVHEKFINLNRNKYSVITVKSPTNNWKYVRLYDTKDLLSPLNSIKAITLTIFAISCGVLLLLSFFVSKKLYYPIHELFLYTTNVFTGNHKQASRNPVDSMNFDIVKRYMQDITNQQNELRLKVSQDKLIVNENNVRKLLRAEIDPDVEFIRELFDSDPKEFIIFSVENYSNSHDKIPASRFYSTVKSIIESFSVHSYQYLTTDIDESLMCMILYSSHTGFFGKPKEMLFDYCHDILTQLEAFGYKTISIGVSPLVTDIREINPSFLSSLIALKHRLYAGDTPITFFEDIPQYQTVNIGVMSAEFNSKLSNAVKEKNIDKTETILTEIMDNISNKLILPENAYSLLSLMRDVLFDIPASMGYAPDEIFFRDYRILYDKFKYNQNLKDYMTYFLDIANNIITGLNVKSSQKHKELTDDIKEYLIEHIDEDISLTSIADIYGISAPYLSTLFKQETGQNFIKFVVSLKMEVAKNLIINTPLLIKEIAEKVGYYNDRSFYNTFKKHYGITPNEYRSQHKK